MNYDRVFMAVNTAIQEYGLERPALFQSEGIDRRSMTYFNTNNEVCTGLHLGTFYGYLTGF